MELTEIEKELFGLCEMNPIETDQPQKAPTSSHDDARDSQESSVALGGRPQRRTKSKKKSQIKSFVQFGVWSFIKVRRRLNQISNFNLLTNSSIFLLESLHNDYIYDDCIPKKQTSKDTNPNGAAAGAPATTVGPINSEVQDDGTIMINTVPSTTKGNSLKK